MLKKGTVEQGVKHIEIDLVEDACIKWICICTGHMVDQGSVNCGLCRMYNDSILSCKKCPISRKTGMAQCHGIEWDKWGMHQSKKHGEICQCSSGLKTRCPGCVNLAYNLFSKLMDVRDAVILDLEILKADIKREIQNEQST